MARFSNPVLSGFHPDPSVCRVGDDFYLATSSFHFFPGLPLRRSRNLVDWEPAGHALDRPSQLDLSGTAPSRGLFAPTLRHDGRRFWLACTEVDRLGNFLMSAPAIEGPWSDPVPVAVGGIDPSLHFEADGSAWLCSNGEVGGKTGIALSVIEPGTGKVLEGPRHICPGSGGRWPEGPHLFRRGGAWYLLLSEGGTEYGHYVAVFRAASPWGPWEACPRNPVLSHRDDASNPIQCVGHADLVEDSAGRWWLLCLGTRPLGPLLHNLGRETFLAPVLWDNEGWPVIGCGGRIDLEMEAELPGPPPAWPPTRRPARPAEAGMEASPPLWSDSFDGPCLDHEWVSVRGRDDKSIRIGEGGGLELAGSGVGLSDPGIPALVARPQPEVDCAFETELEFDPAKEGDEAGVAAYYDEDYHYAAFVSRREGRPVLVLRRRVHDLEADAPVTPIPEGRKLRLRIEADAEWYRFSYSVEGESPSWTELGKGRTAGLCSEGTWRMSFTGTHFALYCRAGTARFGGVACVAGKPRP